MSTYTEDTDTQIMTLSVEWLLKSVSCCVVAVITLLPVGFWEVNNRLSLYLANFLHCNVHYVAFCMFKMFYKVCHDYYNYCHMFLFFIFIIFIVLSFPPTLQIVPNQLLDLGHGLFMKYLLVKHSCPWNCKEVIYKMPLLLRLDTHQYMPYSESLQ